MYTDKVHSEATAQSAFKAKLSDYAQLTKLRLASLVVFSAVMGYLLGASQVLWLEMLFLTLGGFLVTAASNTINQIIERDSDKFMKRTQDRPLAAGRMEVPEAIILSIVLGAAGLLIIWFGLNPLAGVLSFLSLFMYTALYTPLKKVTSWAVFVGAFPGAFPPMLGYVAATGEFGLVPGLLFFVQFMWQFPHFWAIAWKAHGDYLKAGINLLPSGRKDRASTFQVLVYTIFLIPASVTPFFFGVTGYISLIGALLLGAWFLSYAIKFFNAQDDKHALKLMFASFAYLPIIQILYVIDKL